MFLGSLSGNILHAYLTGMKRGGDWLDLPPFDGLTDLVDKIAACSRESYGSDFAAYRIYESNAETLLKWGGLDANYGDSPTPRCS